MNELSELAKCYLAAMLDAEGTITISRRKGLGKRSKNGREWQYKCVVLITNSHAGLIHLFKEMTGMGVVYMYKTAPKENWAPVHRWQVVSLQARDLLKVIRPYLVIKRAAADVVLDMPLQSKGGLQEADQAVYSQQEQAFELVKRLNLRGKKDFACNDFPKDHPVLLSLIALNNRH